VRLVDKLFVVRLYQMDKSSLKDHADKIRRVLCDRDPCVMGASLPLLHDLVKDDVAAYKDLVPSLVSILKQIVEHRLPREFDYHRIPAPWIQMSILRILALLGRGDQASSEGMYEVLVDVMRRADTGINVGYAIVYQTVHTVTTIYPNTLLLDAAATSISRFIRSDSHNLKYIGIKGLASIVRDHPRYAVDHQLAVIDCLEDPDETLKRKTLDLLFRMTNAVNVEFIVEKLLSFLSTANDDHFRTDLVGQITQCAERFAPSNAWYVQTMVHVFELAGDKVKLSVAQTLMQLIAEGAEAGDDEEEEEGEQDDVLRTEAVDDFLVLLDKPKLPDILAQAIAWVLGEYGYLSNTLSKESIIDKLCSLCQQSKDPTTRGHVISAIMKLVAQTGSCPARVNEILNLFSKSVSLDVRQRCLEFKALLGNSNTMVDVLPVDASCEDIEVDENLTFLNSFVSQALAAGCPPYSPPANFNDADDDGAKETTLKITPYAKPSQPVAAPNLGLVSSASSAGGSASSSGGAGPSASMTQAPIPAASQQGNQLITSGLKGVSGPWGRKVEPVATPDPVVPPSPAASSIASGFSSPAPVATSTTSTPVAAPAPAPDAPRVLTEKEKMAAALFGGVAGGAKAGAGNRRKSATTGGPAAPSPSASAASLIDSSPMVASPAPVPAPQPQQSNELFDLMSMSTQPAVYSPAPAPAPMSVDIFDNMLMPSNPAPAPPAVPSPSAVPTPTSASRITDVFADMSMNAPPVQMSPAVSPVRPMGMDAFNNMNMSSPTLSYTASSPEARPLNLTTAQFGQRWGSVPFEVKKSVSCKARNLEQLRQSMPQTLGHVESIQQSTEAIYASTVGASSVVLVHVKLHPGRMAADLIIKATTTDICNQQLNFIANALS
jgi:AP-4 complex subunit epsilon-1